MIRDGVVVRVPTAELVPGDVLLLAEGDAVSADGRLVEASSLSLAEASLTGESEPVLKTTATLAGRVALGDRTNMVFSGTAVTRGRGRAIVTGTGMSTEMGRIAGMLEATTAGPTPLQREIHHVGRILSTAVLAIAAVVMAAILLTSEVESAADVVDVLLVGVSLAVAAVPEGLPAVLSVVLAIGVQRMAGHGAIVKELSSVETLGSATVVCSDKTGTLTRNEMTVCRVVTRSGEVEITGSGIRPDGELLDNGHAIAPGPLSEEARIVLSGGSLANAASIREERGDWVVHGDPTEVAFLVAEHKAGFDRERDGRFERVGEVPFTSERMLMTTMLFDARADRVTVVTKGAPDVLLARSTHERMGATTVPIDDARRAEILAAVDALADEAMRTLGVAYRHLPLGTTEDASEDVEHDLVFAGFVGIIDPPRSEARDAIAEARRAGIRVVMITGDHPRTAARIATELGIVAAGGRVVSGDEIGQIDDVTLRDTAREVSVYARVAPEHKLRIIDALQADGNTVAMTGDGVNDAPALKRADIGVAMGIAGTEVAKEAAKMILADDNFSTIVVAVREGRAIFANIRTFLRYLLSSNVGEVFTMFFGVIGAGVIGLREVNGAAAAPLLATQILWINLLTDTAPALALGFDTPTDDVMSQPPRRMTDRLIDAEMQAGIVFVGLIMAVVTLLALDIGLPGGLVDGSSNVTEARTLAFTTLVLAQLFNCFNARSARASATRGLFTNWLLWTAIALSLALQVAVVHIELLNDAFDTAPLRATEWFTCIGLASAVLWAEELRKLARRLALMGNGDHIHSRRPATGEGVAAQRTAIAGPTSDIGQT